MSRAVLTGLLLLLLAGCGRGRTDPQVAENNRGAGLMGMYRYQEALDVFAALLRERPDWHDVKVNLAIATLNRQREGDEARALELLREVIAADPGNLRARYCAGLLLYRAGDPAALELLESVARADPDDAHVAYFHGSALEQAGRSADAEAAYRRALELDPYLRSACYRLSQILPRAGRAEEGAAFLEDFKRLSDNPRARTVDFIYSKMGPKAEALAIGAERTAPAGRPPGPPFAAAGELVPGAGVEWAPRPSGAPLSVTAADLDGDGRLDVFAAGAVRGGTAANAVLRSNGTGVLALDLAHPLAGVGAVNAALWGDLDNDGLTDVYFCRRGPNQLWRQTAPGQFADVTAATGTSGGDLVTVGGALFDADHDGDLDIFCVNADGPNELFSNNLDGSFRAIARAQGVAGTSGPSRQVLAADLDRDRDLDIVVINDAPPHEVYLNDRLWSYRPAPGFDDFRNAPIAAAAAGDRDADGHMEIEAIEVRGDAGRRTRWTAGKGGAWEPAEIPMPAGWGRPAEGAQALPPPGRIALADVDGDGSAEVLLGDAWGVTVWSGAGELLQALQSPAGSGLAGWASVNLDPARGPSIVAARSGAAPAAWGPGPGRDGFASIALSGLNDKAKSMRSNASAIGARLTARIGSRWVVAAPLGADSGPGQSLQPLAIGLGGDPWIDFVSIDWPDGVLQSEVHGVAPDPASPPRDFSAGRLERIAELQRQTSSCPVLFAWDGEKYAFVSDLLGVGGMGYLLAPGEYSPPRPWENFLLPADLLRPRGGVYALKLTEPMEEACYLDEVRLVAYDLPPGWSLALDERMSVAGPEPTGEPRFYRGELLPAAARSDRGEDVTELVAAADLRAAPAGDHDPHFIGRLRESNVITLEFDRPLDAHPGIPLLLADGWIEYPYSQTMFAAWQARAAYDAPTVEAAAPGGPWTVVLDRFGYPAGMPRRMSVALPGLPRGATTLRITTNQEIYWDRLAVVYAEPDPGARRQELRLADALLERPGFPLRTTGPQAQPRYDFDRRSPVWDARRQRGEYTAFGPATDLVAHADGALAIFGPGEGVHLEFAEPPAPPPPGWSRLFVLESRGWCKDMDLFTRDGDTLAPLPGTRDAEAESLHARHNTRPE